MNSSRRRRRRSVPCRDDPSLIKTRFKLIPIKNRERAALMLLGYTGIIFVPGGNFLGFATKGGGQKTWREEEEGECGRERQEGKRIQNILHRSGASFVAYAK